VRGRSSRSRLRPSFIGLPGRHRTAWCTCPTLLEHAPGEEAVGNFKKGEEGRGQVLSIDVERSAFARHQAARGRSVQQFRREPREGKPSPGRSVGPTPGGGRFPWAADLEGYLARSEISRDRVEDPQPLSRKADSSTR